MLVKLFFKSHRVGLVIGQPVSVDSSSVGYLRILRRYHCILRHYYYYYTMDSVCYLLQLVVLTRHRKNAKNVDY